MGQTMRFRLPLVATAALLVLSACSRGKSPGQSSASAAQSSHSPLATIKALIAAREAGDYKLIESLTRPDAAHLLAETLMAVDEFLEANARLCATVHDNVGPGLPRTIDQSQLAASLDIFSPYVEVLDEEVVEGTSATVSFIVDHRLPAKHTKLRKIDGRWYYDPGSVDATNLPAAFRRMARGLRQVREEIESGRLSPKALRDNPERLMNEVRVRLMPGVKLLPPPPAKPKPDGG